MRMRVVDFHTHILPGIDDGSKDLQQSLEMLRAQAGQGIDHVVCTPHFYPSSDNPQRFLARREKAYSQLAAELEKHQGVPALSLGAEVLYFKGISEWDGLKDLKIQGTDCVMIEMPMSEWSERMLDDVAAIKRRQKLTPIIAHVDRYITPLRTYGIPETLADMPVIVQANSSFFLNRFSAPLAFKMLKKGQIQLLGSDCHNMTSRKPDLGQARDIIIKKVGDEAIKKVNELEKNIFSGMILI